MKQPTSCNENEIHINIDLEHFKKTRKKSFKKPTCPLNLDIFYVIADVIFEVHRFWSLSSKMKNMIFEGHRGIIRHMRAATHVVTSSNAELNLRRSIKD